MALRISSPTRTAGFWPVGGEVILQSTRTVGVSTGDPYKESSIERAGTVLSRTYPDLITSKQRLEKLNGIELVRSNASRSIKLSVSARGRSFYAGFRLGGFPKVSSFMSAGMGSSFFRSQDTRNTEFLSGKTGFSRSSWQRWQFSRKARRFGFEPRRKCWRRSGCIRAARSTGG
jgi:hypothetical protein